MNDNNGSQPTAERSTYVVFCQYKENYGIHNNPPIEYWKFKGGETVLVHNCLDVEQAMKAVNESRYVWSNEASVSYVCHACKYEGVEKAEIDEKREWYKERGWVLDVPEITLGG
jgi:hypothetical protein